VKSNKRAPRIDGVTFEAVERMEGGEDRRLKG